MQTLAGARIPRALYELGTSGKKVAIAVTRMIHGETVPNCDALANPEALEQYRGIVRGGTKGP